MAIPRSTDEPVEECKPHFEECAALLEKPSVPEYRKAKIAILWVNYRLEKRASARRWRPVQICESSSNLKTFQRRHTLRSSFAQRLDWSQLLRVKGSEN